MTTSYRLQAVKNVRFIREEALKLQKAKQDSNITKMMLDLGDEENSVPDRSKDVNVALDEQAILAAGFEKHNLWDWINELAEDGVPLQSEQMLAAMEKENPNWVVRFQRSLGLDMFQKVVEDQVLELKSHQEERWMDDLDEELAGTMGTSSAFTNAAQDPTRNKKQNPAAGIAPPTVGIATEASDTSKMKPWEKSKERKKERQKDIEKKSLDEASTRWQVVETDPMGEETVIEDGFRNEREASEYAEQLSAQQPDSMFLAKPTEDLEGEYAVQPSWRKYLDKGKRRKDVAAARSMIRKGYGLEEALNLSAEKKENKPEANNTNLNKLLKEIGKI